MKSSTLWLSRIALVLATTGENLICAYILKDSVCVVFFHLVLQSVSPKAKGQIKLGDLERCHS